MLEDVLAMTPPTEPLTDEHTKVVLEEAVASLGTLRALEWLGDAGAELHVLVSLRDELELAITRAAREARDQGYSWERIAALVGTSPATLRRRVRRATGSLGSSQPTD